MPYATPEQSKRFIQQQKDKDWYPGKYLGEAGQYLGEKFGVLEPEPKFSGQLGDFNRDIKDVNMRRQMDPQFQGLQQGGEVFDMVAGQDEFAWDDPQSPDFQLPPDLTPEENATVQNVQNALFFAGMKPGLGIFPDVANIGFSLGAGDLEGAGDALLAAIPVLGLGVGNYKTIKSLKRALKSGPIKRQLNKLIDGLTSNKKVRKDFKNKITRDLDGDNIVAAIGNRNPDQIRKIILRNDPGAIRRASELKGIPGSGIPFNIGKHVSPRTLREGFAPKPMSPRALREEQIIKDLIGPPKPTAKAPLRPKWDYKITQGTKGSWSRGVDRSYDKHYIPNKLWNKTAKWQPPELSPMIIRKAAPNVRYPAINTIAKGTALGLALKHGLKDTDQPTLTDEERERAIIEQTERTTQEDMMQQFIEGGGYSVEPESVPGRTAGPVPVAPGPEVRVEPDNQGELIEPEEQPKWLPSRRWW